MILGQEDKPLLAELTHHGIKGMKWGVRKPEEHVSRADRKAANANLAKQFSRYEKNMPALEKAISAKTYKSLSTEAVTIKRGAEFVRVTPRKDEKLRDITFVSGSREDQALYRGMIPSGGAFRSTRKDYQTSYEHTFAAAKVLHGPSEKARVDAFIELMDKPVIQTNKGPVTGREYLAKNGFRREVKQMNNVKLGLEAYRYITAQHMSDTPISSAYFESLRKKGYSVVADDNDRGILSKDPLILLDTSSKTIRPKSVRQLTKKEVVDAQKILQVPTNRSGVVK